MTLAHGSAAASAVCALVACGHGTADGGATDDAADVHDASFAFPGDARADDDGRYDRLAPEPTFAPTFSAIYREIFAPSACTLGLCHGEGARGGGLDLYPRGDAYDALVGAPSTSSACAALGLARVEPGDPDASLLVRKLDPTPPCGVLMPPDEPLTPAQIEQVRTWIALGALDD